MGRGEGNEAKHGLTNEKIMLSAAENAFFSAVALNEIDPAEVQSSASDRVPSPDARTFESDPTIDEKNMQHACSVECVHDDAHAEPKSCDPSWEQRLLARGRLGSQVRPLMKLFGDVQVL